MYRATFNSRSSFDGQTRPNLRSLQQEKQTANACPKPHPKFPRQERTFQTQVLREGPIVQVQRVASVHLDLSACSSISDTFASSACLSARGVRRRLRKKSFEWHLAGLLQPRPTDRIGHPSPNRHHLRRDSSPEATSNTADVTEQCINSQHMIRLSCSVVNAYVPVLPVLPLTFVRFSTNKHVISTP